MNYGSLSELGEIGPAMEALTPMRRAFVRAVIEMGRNGIENASEAARTAGYSDGGAGTGIRVVAHNLMHDARVQAALLEEARKKVNAAAAVVATPVAVAIAMDETVPARDRLRACEMLFNRGGLPAQTEHKVTVEHKQPKQLLELAARLAQELGIDEARLIGVNRAAAPLLEGAAVEVVSE